MGDGGDKAQPDARSRVRQRSWYVGTLVDWYIHFPRHRQYSFTVPPRKRESVKTRSPGYQRIGPFPIAVIDWLLTDSLQDEPSSN